MIKGRAFCFKYGFLWIGWVLEIAEEKVVYITIISRHTQYSILNVYGIFVLGLEEKSV